MRFMIIVKGNKDTEAGVMPSAEMIEAMGRYNEELISTGILLTAEGLQESAKGAKVRYSNGKQTVVDGPFGEAKEVIAGFWIIDVKSRDEAIEWAKRVPMMEEGEEVEVRKVFEASDFPPDSVTEETLAKEQAWRDANQKPVTQ